MFFSKNSRKVVQKITSQIGVTIHSHRVHSFEGQDEGGVKMSKFAYSDVGEGGVAGNFEKAQFFRNTLDVFFSTDCHVNKFNGV